MTEPKATDAHERMARVLFAADWHAESHTPSHPSRRPLERTLGALKTGFMQ